MKHQITLNKYLIQDSTLSILVFFIFLLKVSEKDSNSILN
jgi:hypothetical protein